MSRLFDALQRSGTEQSGVEYPDMISVATQVFEAPKTPAPLDPQVAAGIPLPPCDASTTPLSVPEEAALSATHFPSLQISVPPAMRLVYYTQPDSLAAEKFRFLGVRLRQLRQSRHLKKVLITSTIPEEGKSVVSANLAGVLARRKERVLLIEGDLRRPVFAQRLGLAHIAGLGEWLRTDSSTLDNIYHLEGPGFWLMPAGSPPDNPLELMQSGKLSSLMNQLPTLFDWIIVDSPPLLPLADTTVWSRLTDGTLLVTRQGTTHKTALQRGLELLKKQDILGVVLNSSASPDNHKYYHYYPSPPKN